MTKLRQTSIISKKLRKKERNEFIFQFTCLQPHLYIKIYILENDDEQHFN